MRLLARVRNDRGVVTVKMYDRHGDHEERIEDGDEYLVYAYGGCFPLLVAVVAFAVLLL